MKVLGIIPARANSKGVVNKNRQLLNGKALVMHAIDVAIESKALDKIVLSTDDDMIIDMASSCQQIEVPFKRPAELAQDNSLISDVILHLLKWYQITHNYIPDAFMLLEPTSPMRSAEDIRTAMQQFATADKDCLVAVSEPQQHPSNMIFNNGDHWQYCLQRKKSVKGRQDFHAAWFINGAVYITKTNFFMKTKQVYDLQSASFYRMPLERAIDINSEFDLELARYYAEQRNKNSKPKKEIYA